MAHYLKPQDPDTRQSDDYPAGIGRSHMPGKPKNTAAIIATDFRALQAGAFTAAVRYRF